MRGGRRRSPALLCCTALASARRLPGRRAAGGGVPDAPAHARARRSAVTRRAAGESELASVARRCRRDHVGHAGAATRPRSSCSTSPRERAVASSAYRAPRPPPTLAAGVRLRRDDRRLAAARSARRAPSCCAPGCWPQRSRTGPRTPASAGKTSTRRARRRPAAAAVADGLPGQRPTLLGTDRSARPRAGDSWSPTCRGARRSSELRALSDRPAAGAVADRDRAPDADRA